MANFPTSVSTNSNLYIAVNGIQTTLAASILATDTTIQLTSTTGFPTTGYVTIDNSEVVLYTGISGPNLTGCTRGADGTTAAPHSLGVTVGATIVAAHHNLLKDEIIAIETFLGVNGANVQPAGNYITALTSDVSATGPGSAAATVNSVGGSSAANVHSAELAANAATPNPTASTIVKRDANANAQLNTIVEGFATTPTAAGTTALTAASAPIQQFTGTTTQTVTLPNATTLPVGYQINVLNRSTGVVSVNNFGSVLQSAINGATQTTFTLTNNGTSNGVWDVSTSSGASALFSYVEYVVGTASGAYSGSTTVFDLPFGYNTNGQSLSVFYNGQQIIVTDDYTETSATRITTVNPLVVGTKIWFRTISSTTVVSPVTLFREDYVVGTALNNYTGSTTVFNLVNTYNVGGNAIVVTVDGDVQTKGATVDYLETNNSTVTFNNALVSGQKVSFMWANTAPAGGTINSGTANKVPYYPATGTILSPSNSQVNAAGYIKGTVVQTVQVIDTSASSNSGTSFVSTTTTATITPLASTHKIRISISGSFQSSTWTAPFVYATIARNGTDLSSGGFGFLFIGNTVTTMNAEVPGAIVYLDAPASTSALTYALQIKCSGAGGSALWNNNNVNAIILIEEIAF